MVLTRKSQPISEFYELGMKEVFVISAKNNIGLNELKEKISSVGSSKTYVEKDIFRRISIIGKPNAGKSTLINTILHEERMIISDIAGTTLDAIEIPFKFKDNNFLDMILLELQENLKQLLCFKNLVLAQLWKLLRQQIYAYL